MSCIGIDLEESKRPLCLGFLDPNLFFNKYVPDLLSTEAVSSGCKSSKMAASEASPPSKASSSESSSVSSSLDDFSFFNLFLKGAELEEEVVVVEEVLDEEEEEEVFSATSSSSESAFLLFDGISLVFDIRSFHFFFLRVKRVSTLYDLFNFPDPAKTKVRNHNTDPYLTTIYLQCQTSHRFHIH